MCHANNGRIRVASQRISPGIQVGELILVCAENDKWVHLTADDTERENDCRDKGLVVRFSNNLGRIPRIPWVLDQGKVRNLSKKAMESRKLSSDGDDLSNNLRVGVVAQALRPMKLLRVGMNNKSAVLYAATSALIRPVP